MGHNLKQRKDKKELLTQEACWQYLLDHCIYETEAGFVIASMVIPSEKTFYNRLEARKRGLYRRTLADIKLVPNHSKWKKVLGRIKFALIPLRKDYH